jgi:hypothetical protein
VDGGGQPTELAVEGSNPSWRTDQILRGFLVAVYRLVRKERIGAERDSASIVRVGRAPRTWSVCVAGQQAVFPPT